MYAITAPRYIIDYESQGLVQNFSLIGEDLKKLLSGIYLHSGRTDSSGGHKDKKNKSGLSSYHYHHGVSAHLHPDGVCPYGSKQTFIINPYTGKKISLGQPYFIPYYDENGPNIEYYSLNLVSKALTVHDSMGVELALNNTGGIFNACSVGDSSMNNIGDLFAFSYPTFLTIRQDNTFFETNNDKLQLLCHTKKATLDDTSCYAYISLETVRDYMTKDGYFTDFSDNGSGIWNFTVRKPVIKNVKITSSNNNAPPFNVGDTLTIEVDIDNVANAQLTIGTHIEDKDKLLNQNSVKFNNYVVTNGDTGILTVKVEVSTGGTAIGAETVTSTVQIQVEEPENPERMFETLDSYLLGNTSDSEADKVLREIVGNQTLDIYKTSNLNDTNDYQRYDAYIIAWTIYHNNRFFNNGGIQINSAIIKAMMWKESKMGYYNSASPNANVSIDVLQTLDPRNPPVYEFSTYPLDTAKNVKILDGNSNYVLPITIDPLYNHKKGRTNYETPVADRLFKKEADGFYYYQYQNASPLLSVALGIKEYAIKLSEANGNALIAAQNYNGSANKVQYMNDVEALAFKGGYSNADSYN